MEYSEILDFLWIAVALLAGLMFTRLFKKLNINCPDVTAFLIAGLLIGPNILGRLGVEGLGFTTYDSVKKLSIISDAALGFIAFSIGSEFKLNEIKNIGKTATVIGIVQAVCASALVDIVLIVLHFVLGEEVLPLSVAIVMGAIASATAPAATLMVVRQYKANGPLTKLLLPIVALDDAVGLIIFAISLGVAQAIQGGTINIISIVVNPLLEIVCSLLLGSCLGYILSKLEKLFFSNSNRTSLAIALVLLTVGLSALKINIGSVVISFSSLLVCMMCGTLLCNLSEYADDIMKRISSWTAPLNACFFVISGAELQVEVFSNISYVLIGTVYIVVRCLGKYFGSNLSAKYMKCDDNIVKYLGITLFPQAGVALGMCKQSVILGSMPSTIIINLTLFGVLIYELVGPTLTKNALLKAGEINTDNKVNRRTKKEV